ncbi:unnamed protein product [Brachionus calyciflorus]|uniref:UTP6 n=1 Tax=Brachionus calyciflorus TaxID=104777 RepID=A0A814HU10_9BILA|nr:unnamed protein product [Brachionus calyciflorus]
MAEFAQRGIEEMLIEVEKMRKIGLFSTEETRAIMKKRKRFEYKMQRRTKEKEVYLQYIQYEIGVLQLIKLRREKRSIELGKDEIEKEIVLRIYKLFRIACFRFNSDVKLWLTYADFANKNFDKERVSKIYTTMLQTHNKKPNLWIIAAKHEFEANESIETARNLFQRAIRFLPKCQKLWIEYFKMELLCIELIQKRKELLGIKESESEDKKSEPISRVEDAILSCKIVEIIYKNAIKEFENNVPDLINSFIFVAKDFNFTQNLIENMYKSLSEDENLSKIEETQDVLAKRHLLEEGEILKKCEKSGQIADFTIAELEEKANSAYLESLEKLNTEKMHLIYIDFLIERLKLNSQYLSEERFERLNDAFSKTETKYQLKLDYLIEWIRYLIKFKKTTEAYNLVEKYLEKFKTSKDLWAFYLHLNIEKTTKENEKNLIDLFRKSIGQIRESESFDLWEIILNWILADESEYTEKLLQEGSCIMRSDISLFARLKYLSWAFEKGVDKVRDVYNGLRQVPPYDVDFYLKYIQIEKSLSKMDEKRVEKVFEDALMHFGGDNVDLWLSFIEFKQNINKTQDVANLYWRAMKQLDANQVEIFTQKFCLFKIDVSGDNQPNDVDMTE